ncbi:hypothetical protein BKA83DRAFT_4178175 [Pisolithus microcarpus]|nr:hypothetical protein BKA83DRAFT_4178175 [Pisolithus microcarpus]
MESTYRRSRSQVKGLRAFSGYMRVSGAPSSLPSIRYQSSSPVEYSRSRSRRCSQGSSSTKLHPRFPFEPSPRTSKYPPHSRELASSSSSPLRVTNAGSWHPVVRPHRCDHGWQAGDSPLNPLRSSREDRDSCWRPPRDPSLISKQCLRPSEPSIPPSNLFPRLETPSKTPSKLSSPLETHPKPPSHLKSPQGTLFLLREASTSTSKPAPASFESRSRASSGLFPLREYAGSSEPSPGLREASRHRVQPRRYTFCFFCGRDGHIRARCRVCSSYLAAGRCRIVRGRVVLPTGDEIPREALGRTLQAQLDSWAVTRGPDRLAEQVPFSPSSSESTQPLIRSRVNPETILERLWSLRAPTSPSRASQSPSSTSQTLDRKLRSFELSPSRIPRLITASRRFVPPSRAPPVPFYHISRPVQSRAQSRLRPPLCSLGSTQPSRPSRYPPTASTHLRCPLRYLQVTSSPFEPLRDCLEAPSSHFRATLGLRGPSDTFEPCPPFS